MSSFEIHKSAGIISEVLAIDKYRENFTEFLEKNGFKTEKDLKKFLLSNMKTQYEQGIKQIEKKELMDLLELVLEEIPQKMKLKN